ncbi:membrane protein CcdC involved in cytochrome C biogenesis [Fontibacillus phaseoli]|uniref:Membrane protein CcdC involved in cytochrome C biogenesis n=1 Tax=Fontibacillus phaseoli TaxID=1416533 RepID=A0A369BBZ3_9BACL|nr:cytochrome c biogenesis protein CcdC [Fontibacillus phaseoli]RCX18096.1 membrane protein CcdC involved in cytochrome C biogenesis [Fontibacillus phaseoli]
MNNLINSSYIQWVVTIGAALMAVSVLIIRLKASRKPVTIKKIIIPPLGMSTGFAMFFAPEMHIPLSWALIAFVVGALLFSYPLIRTTHFEIVGDEVFAKRSPGFAYILIGLLVIRLALHEVVEQYISVLQTGSVFFLLAFGMILRWRMYMLKEYRAITGLTDPPAQA